MEPIALLEPIVSGSGSFVHIVMIMVAPSYENVSRDDDRMTSASALSDLKESHSLPIINQTSSE